MLLLSLGCVIWTFCCRSVVFWCMVLELTVRFVRSLFPLLLSSWNKSFGVSFVVNLSQHVSALADFGAVSFDLDSMIGSLDSMIGLACTCNDRRSLQSPIKIFLFVLFWHFWCFGCLWCFGASLQSLTPTRVKPSIELSFVGEFQ